AVLSLQRRQRRYLVRMSRDMRLSQFAQVVEQRNRVGAGIEHLPVRLEDDLKCRTNLGRWLRFAALFRGWIFSRRQQSRERAAYFHLSWDDSPFRFLLDNQPNDVASLKSAIDQIRRDGQTPFPCQVKGFFHLVSKP